MEDFRNEYGGNKRKGNGWVIVLTCFSVLALVFSTVSLYRSNQLASVSETGGADSNNVGIQVATTNVSGTEGTAVTNTDSVVGVADAMKNKVVYIGVYGRSSSFSNSVQYAQIGSGSGFIVSEQGYIVTNYHVIEDGSSFKVKVNSEEEYDASVIGYDSYSDLAVLKIQGANKKFDSVVLGDSNAVKVGELAVAIGSPLGEALNNTVTVGYISAKDREITSNSHTAKMIQTDAAINPGNSGGPLLNSSGQVIGINTMKSTVAGYDSYGNAISADGISFAIPISDALPIVTEIIQTGKYQRPGIGISYYTIDSETAQRNNLPEGLLIRSVNSNSPASQAGLQTDDIIVGVDGQEIKTGTQLNDYLNTKKVGDTIKITVNRNGNNIDVDLTLGDLNEITSNSEAQDNTQQFPNRDQDGSGWIWPF